MSRWIAPIPSSLRDYPAYSAPRIRHVSQPARDHMYMTVLYRLSSGDPVVNADVERVGSHSTAECRAHSVDQRPDVGTLGLKRTPPSKTLRT